MGFICACQEPAHRQALGAGAVAPAGVLPATGRSETPGEGGYRRASLAVEGRAGVARRE